jgi:CRISPR-associated protein Cas5t
MTGRVEQQPADYRPAESLRLWLRLRAPFAAFRPMQAGSLRTTLPSMPYSAAWGLLLNLAGIDARSEDPEHHGTDPGAPCLRLCLGHGAAAQAREKDPFSGSHHRLFQHLHGYPVGRSSQRFQRGAHGAKYHIAPAQREILTDLDLIVGIEEAADHSIALSGGQPPPANAERASPESAPATSARAEPSTRDAATSPYAPIAIIPRIRAALAGTATWPRSGLPFAGDNNLLFDHIEALTSVPSAHWLTRISHDRSHAAGPQAVTRLHVGIDRHDSSRTTTVEVAPLASATTDIPGTAWVWTPHPPYRPPLTPFASGR